jgi:type I site-specific restriction endonuclease
MAKTTGKRGPTTPKGHKSRAEAVLARKAVQHHEFVGEADPEREKSRAEEEQRIERDHEQLEKEIVREMEQEFEEQEATSSPIVDLLRSRPKSIREAVQLLREKGPDVAAELRERAAELRERAGELREMAEKRIASMPAPIRDTVHLYERALGLMIAPVKFGVQAVARAMRTPADLLRAFARPRRSA